MGVLPAHDVRTPLLRELQLNDALDYRARNDQGAEEPLFLFRPRHPQSEVLAAAKAVKALLGLNPEATEFHIVFGGSQANDTQIALLTRSIFGIFSEAATGIDMPARDVAESRVTKPAAPERSDEVTPQNLLRVRSSSHKPDSSEAFSAVQYRGSCSGSTIVTSGQNGGWVSS